jgi:hypothetical protein
MNLRRQTIPAVAVSVAFWAWCALISYPMINESYDLAELVHEFTSSRTAAIGQATGLSMFVTTMCIAYPARLRSAIGNLNLAQLAILLIVYLSVALQLHGQETATLTGIFYTSLLLATVLTLSVLWTLDPDDFEKCFGAASVILCLFGISAIAFLGWPKGRNIGGIQPNLFAAPLLTAFIFAQFRPGVLGILVRILCFGMVALVSSRFALIGCVAALVLFELTFNSRSLWNVLALIIALVAGVLFSSEIVSVLGLDDSTRGLSSGFSGRDEYWYGALAAIADNPLGIGFKRAIGDESGHNGYLKTLLEFGVVGGGLMILLLACSIVMAGIEAIETSGKTRQQHRFACARFGGLVALSFGAFFQPQLLSLGDTFGIAFLLLLFKPRTEWMSLQKPIPKTASVPMHQS